jgi:hypothetical protein
MSPPNTVIVAYRNRPAALAPFLDLFATAAGLTPNRPNLVVCSLGSSPEDQATFDQWRRTACSRGKWLEIDYSGPFNKSMALNTALAEVDTPLVTMLDVDAMISPNFFACVDGFYADRPVSQKLCHRVRYFGKNRVTSNFTAIRKALKLYKVAKEWFSFYGQPVALKDVPKKKQTPELFRDHALGCSHYTASTQRVLDMGGYSQLFEGWGWEDVEFNFRYWSRYGGGTMVMGDPYIVMNRPHEYVSHWHPKRHESTNVGLFRSLQQVGFPTPPRDETWSFPKRGS